VVCVLVVLSRFKDVHGYLEGIRGKSGMARKELCYGKAETLEDAEEVRRWWQYNLLR